MTTKEEAVAYALTFKDSYKDMPFSKSDMICIRIQGIQKVFAWIFEREGYVWINVKCSADMRELYRSAYKAVVPAYHLNKEHWNSIILDGSIPKTDIQRMIGESYDLVRMKHKK